MISGEKTDSIQDGANEVEFDSFDLQLNNYDHYMAYPTSLDRTHGSSLPLKKFHKVPVIRIFGCLRTGHQVLCHVHGIFPYFFVKYDGQEDDTSIIINEKCAKLHQLLEQILRDKMKSKGSRNDKQDETNLNELVYIANVSVVKGVPFYGYHVGWTPFYKISLLNPSLSEQVCNIIREQNVLQNGQNEVYESQFPYLLKFTADFNLFACSWINFKKVYFRAPVLNEMLNMDEIMMTKELRVLLDRFHSKDTVLKKTMFPRIGNGLLEIDVIPQFIKNIDQIKIRNIHHDLSEKKESVNYLDDGPYVSSTKNMLKDVEIQRKLYSLEEYKKAADISRNENDMIWNSSHQFEMFLRKALSSVKVSDKDSNFLSGHFNANDFLKTPFEMIDELWPTKFESSIDLNDENERHDKNDQLLDVGEDFDKAEERDDDILGEPNEDDYIEKEMHSQDNGQFINVSTSVISTAQSLDKLLTQSTVKNQRKLKIGNVLSDLGNVATNYHNYFPSNIKKYYRYKQCNISYSSMNEDLQDNGLPINDYMGPFFSDPCDLHKKDYQYAGKQFDITSTHLMKRYPLDFKEDLVRLTKQRLDNDVLFASWKYLKMPPSFNDVAESVTRKERARHSISQIKKPTATKSLGNTSSIKRSESIHDNLTHFSLEIHVNTRGDLLPDPRKDEVSVIFWKVDNDTFPFSIDLQLEGIMYTNKLERENLIETLESISGGVPIMEYEDEFSMFDALTDLILLFDPDLLSGYEIHNSSWGYIFERSLSVHKFNIANEISRVNMGAQFKLRDSWGFKKSSGISITGRYVLNIWRLLRKEIAVTQYSFENMVHLLLKIRLPKYSCSHLTSLWSNFKTGNELKTFLNYYMTRVRLNIGILKKISFTLNVMEEARLIGIDFQSVYNRGSQYKVESFLIRICKSENYILLSPSKVAVQKQKPLECVPLVMEPESAFYKSPLLVLDFQSLYPSIMSGYNYCYSTMMGRVRELDGTKRTLGVTNFELKSELLKKLRDDICIAPNGVIYAKEHLRKSTLSKMLSEILEIRFMIKKTISDLGSDHQALKKLLESKQLALKLLANVTYGYTSASFSGRMPCSDLADSIVQTGRETLEKAVKMIESTASWGAKVVYGDTDSLFVYLPGKTKEDAFRIGAEISNSITASNPKPITLKFEKVYFPCILLSKKRYVGYSYLSSSQLNPHFDAKGIETVRRDGTPAQQKVVENALRILFETKDLSKVKNYVVDTFTKIRSGNISIQDFCFAKEIKLGHYKSESTMPPGAVVAKRLKKQDSRAEPQYKERLSYLVVKGKSGQILRERCVSVSEYFSNDHFALDAEYYITKTLIPPLDRLFNIVGISVSDWNQEGPMFVEGSIKPYTGADNIPTSTRCKACEQNTVSGDSYLCDNCVSNEKMAASKLIIKIQASASKLKVLNDICRICSRQYTGDMGLLSSNNALKCVSYDCPNYYSKLKAQRLMQSKHYYSWNELLHNMDHW